MRRRKVVEANPRAKPKEILVFGENGNDRESLSYLVRALRPEAPRVRSAPHPLVLIRGVTPSVRLDTQTRISQVVKAGRCRANIIAVVAHSDCDECEPAHEAHAEEIEATLRAVNIPQPVAPSPAFEMETWWYLWPDAVAAVRGCWKPLPRTNRNVGKIRDAKEALKRALRTTRQCPDYTESDSPKIAAVVMQMGIVRSPVATSASFTRFKNKIDDLKF